MWLLLSLSMLLLIIVDADVVVVVVCISNETLIPFLDHGFIGSKESLTIIFCFLSIPTFLFFLPRPHPAPSTSSFSSSPTSPHSLSTTSGFTLTTGLRGKPGIRVSGATIFGRTDDLTPPPALPAAAAVFAATGPQRPRRRRTEVPRRRRRPLEVRPSNASTR